MMLPVAQGSDGGGSVRIPASLCHLYGFKPSLSLLGNLHGPINRLGMSVMGPLTHHVEDAAAMLDVLRGNHHTHKGDDASSCLARMRIAPRPLRIRVSYTSPLGRIEPEMVAATEATARTLESLGHHIETVAMMTVELEDFLPLWQLMIATVPSPAERWLEPVTQWLRRAGRKLDVDAVKRRQRELSARLDTQIGDADVFLTPTVPVTPPRVGSLAHLEPEALFRAVSDLGAFTAAFNISHGPAASLPAGVSSAGVPIGVQIGARPGDDHLLLALSRQLEEAQPWRQRVAPLAAS
jgi:amidase